MEEFGFKFLFDLQIQQMTLYNNEWGLQIVKYLFHIRHLITISLVKNNKKQQQQEFRPTDPKMKNTTTLFLALY